MRTAAIVSGLVFTLALAGCGDANKSTVAAAKPADVVVDLPLIREVLDYEEFSGRTEAVSLVEVRARVTGYLDKVHFKEGADVRQGDLLFEIDPRTYKAQLDKAVTDIGQIKARLGRINSDYARGEKLLKQKVISQEEADHVIYEKAEATASIAAAEATRESAALNVGFTRVTAPISGRISRRNVDPGNLVKADDTMLTTIVSLDPLNAYFDIDERTLLRLRRLEAEGKIKTTSGSDSVIVQVGLADEEGFSMTGLVDFVDNKVDPNTGTLRIRAVVANPKHVLSPGLFVRLRLPIGRPHPATLVPEEAVGSDQGQKFLYVVNGDDEVLYRRVKVGQLDEGLRVIETGIAPGERVVVSGLQRVRPGNKVHATPVDKSTKTAQATDAADGKTPAVARGNGPAQVSNGR